MNRSREQERRLKKENGSRRAEQSCLVKPMEKGFAVLRSAGELAYGTDSEVVWVSASPEALGCDE